MLIQYRTNQWAYFVLISFAIVNLFLSVYKAHGKLMWTILFNICGMSCIAIVYWFTMYNPRLYVFFVFLRCRVWSLTYRHTHLRTVRKYSGRTARRAFRTAGAVDSCRCFHRARKRDPLHSDLVHVVTRETTH